MHPGPLLATALVSAALLASCKAKTVQDAEASQDVAWLATQGTTEAVAALGRLADSDPRAVEALRARPTDVNAYIAAWAAVTRSAPWGAQLLKSGLGDPERADVAAAAMPRRDPRLVPFVQDLEGAVSRLSAGRQGGVVASILASVGRDARAAVERRLVDPKTRGAMCDGISTPEASGDAKSALLAVPADARDHASCVANVIDMASREDAVLGWLATAAEPGLLSAVAKSALPCPRVASIWAKALAERPAESHAALSVPLQIAMKRCSSALDEPLADLLGKAPGARACIVNAIVPTGADLASMSKTCAALAKGYMNAEGPRVRERAADAVSGGCKLAR